MKVFIANTSLASPYGGPARSVSGLATALADAGIDVGLWAADQSAPTTPFVPRDSPARRLTGSCTAALEAFGGADVLHDNGIWRRHHHRLAQVASRRRIPRLVSTRGMLAPWSLGHKSLRKSLAWPLYQRRDLELASCHHVTSEAEARNVADLGLGVPVQLIPNGVHLPELAEARFGDLRSARVRTALFVGRLHPIKGLPILIDAWARVRPAEWVLKIAGPDEAGHLQQVEDLVRRNSLDDVISFLGPLGDDSKRRALLAADLMVLPSYSESFGMAVAEALSHGLPALTTTAVPWPALAEVGCGWRVEPTVEGMVEGLRQATAVDRPTLRKMGARGRDFVACNFSWTSIAKEFIALYQRVMTDAHPRP